MASKIRLVKKIWNWFRHPVKSLKRLFKRPVSWAKRYLKNATKQQIIKWLSAYLGTTVVATYLTTALFTPASLFRPAQVLSVMESTGIVNTLTFGLEAPIVNGVKGALGDAASTIGSAIGNSSLVTTGANLKNQAAEYFSLGEGVFDAAGGYIETGKGVIGSAADAVASIFGGTDTSSSSSNTATVSVSTDGTSSDEVVNGKRWTEFDASKYPNYVRLYSDAVIKDYTVEAGQIAYTGIDSLGRTRRAVGNITYDMVEESAGWRAGFASDADSISGWGHNLKVTLQLANGKTYNGWFWNRSHLIADSLGGYNHVYNSDGTINESASKSERQNLITGSRTQNVGANDGKGGMQYFENLVVSFLEANPTCSVWYSADPVYEGDELVPRSVIVKAVSCNSDGTPQCTGTEGHGLNIQGEVFNVGDATHIINYMTGEVTVTE